MHLKPPKLKRSPLYPGTHETRTKLTHVASFQAKNGAAKNRNWRDGKNVKCKACNKVYERGSIAHFNCAQNIFVSLLLHQTCASVS